MKFKIVIYNYSRTHTRKTGINGGGGRCARALRENYKTLLKETKEDLTKWRDI